MIEFTEEDRAVERVAKLLAENKGLPEVTDVVRDEAREYAKLAERPAGDVGLREKWQAELLSDRVIEIAACEIDHEAHSSRGALEFELVEAFQAAFTALADSTPGQPTGDVEGLREWLTSDGAAKVMARHRHELDHVEGFDDRPWDRLRDPEQDVRIENARDDLDAVLAALADSTEGRG
jgi:hypothetical protein